MTWQHDDSLLPPSCASPRPAYSFRAGTNSSQFSEILTQYWNSCSKKRIYPYAFQIRRNPNLSSLFFNLTQAMRTLASRKREIWPFEEEIWQQQQHIFILWSGHWKKRQRFTTINRMKLPEEDVSNRHYNGQTLSFNCAQKWLLLMKSKIRFLSFLDVFRCDFVFISSKIFSNCAFYLFISKYGTAIHSSLYSNHKMTNGTWEQHLNLFSVQRANSKIKS